MRGYGNLDRRITEVEEFLNRLAVDHVTGRIYLSNVIDFNKAKEKLRDTDKKIVEPIKEDVDPLIEAERRNKANEERIKREREQANKGVLRDYRIKD